jgi:3'(2'), 5'-bisphosphate nucleotidase
MKPLDHGALAEALLPAILRAARVEMRHYASGVAVERKADASPVTAADREAEAVLLEALWQAARGVPVIAEESMSLAAAPRPGSMFFLVDPLDGTREFADRCGEFTINIGLVADGAPVFGMIYAPAFSTLYVTLREGQAVEAQISPESTGVSLSGCALSELRAREPQPGALVALQSRFLRSPETDAFLARHAISHTRRVGSSLKFCLLARGEADCYPRFGPTKEWDTAAGQAILAAAGGHVIAADGLPLRYGKAQSDYLNPHFVAWGRRPQDARTVTETST